MLRPIIDESLVPFYRIAAIKEFVKICSSRECYINRRLTPVGSRGLAITGYYCTASPCFRVHVYIYTVHVCNVIESMIECSNKIFLSLVSSLSESYKAYKL